ncbi:MAG: aspartate 1-decarboxylase [Flavobacteriales bacterium]
MRIDVVRAKIHRATVTEADLNYQGSITLDEELMEASGILSGEKVQVVNINNGERLWTYVIKGERGSGSVCLNGPAARKMMVDDIVLIIAYANMEIEEAESFQPKIIFPDTPTNRIN